MEHNAAEDLAKTATWLDNSLRYEREHSQWKVVRLLEAVEDEIELEGVLLALLAGEHLGPEVARVPAKNKGLRENQRVAGMVDEVLAHQARLRAEQTGEPFEGALEAVLETEAGRQLRELRDGPYRDQSAKQWQEDMARKRDRERAREHSEKEKRAQQVAAWERFVRTERRELELRKEGQLAGGLGEPLPGESPAALGRLASEDRKQAREGLVALMSGGKV